MLTFCYKLYLLFCFGAIKPTGEVFSAFYLVWHAPRSCELEVQI